MNQKTMFFVFFAFSQVGRIDNIAPFFRSLRSPVIILSWSLFFGSALITEPIIHWLRNVAQMEITDFAEESESSKESGEEKEDKAEEKLYSMIGAFQFWKSLKKASLFSGPSMFSSTHGEIDTPPPEVG